MSAVAPASRPAEQLQRVTLSSGRLVQTRIVKPWGTLEVHLVSATLSKKAETQPS